MAAFELIARLLLVGQTLAVLYTPSHEANLCATKSSCNKGGNLGFLQSCVANSEPEAIPSNGPMDSEAFYFFNYMCPHLAKSRTSEVCCDTPQLLQLKNQIGVMESLLGRCPSCLQNFYTLWCNIMCHPDQATFTNVTKAHPFTANRGDEGTVHEFSTDTVTVWLEDSFATKLYESCNKVSVPSTSQPVMTTLCGKGSIDQCSPQGFLDYIGSRGNGRSPSDINFVLVNSKTAFNLPKGIRPMETPLYFCNETGHNNTDACTCVDCANSCSAMKTPSYEEWGQPGENPWLIFGVPGYVIVVVAIYIAVACIYVVVSYMHCLYYKKSNAEDLSYTLTDDRSIRGVYSAGGSGVAPPEYKEKGASEDSSNGVTIVEIGVFEQMGRRFQQSLRAFFFRWGLAMSYQPVAALLFGGMVVAICSNGLNYLEWTTDPVDLWSSSTSQAYQEMEHFNHNFGPFYRIEQIIIKLNPNHTLTAPHIKKHKSSTYSPLFAREILHDVLYLQENITNLVAWSEKHERNVTLSDICFKPMAPVNPHCAILSPTEWFQNSHENIDHIIYGTGRRRRIPMATHYQHLEACIKSPIQMDDMTEFHASCLASWGGPVDPMVALGGFSDEVQFRLNDPKHYAEFEKANAFVVTFMVKNSLDRKERELAEDFEAEYLKTVQRFIAANPHLSMAYQAQRSIQDEIERESMGDVKTVICSYLIMFGYITLCLGKVGGIGWRSLVDVKVTLGVGGVAIVLCSVACSIGVFGFIGVPATLIIMEVVPFLVLAVGVDNIFILVQYFQRYRPENKNECLEVQVATVFSRVAPSMLLSSCAEALAFFLGAMTPMPAVRTFSLYAGMAVAFDFLFQITCFVGLLTLDAKRQRDARMDVVCCVPVDQCDKPLQQEGMVYSLFRNYYSPILFSDAIRPLVVVTFVGWFLACLCMIPHIPIGLDQSLTLPQDSYMRDYFKAISEDLNVGSPVYFVIKDPYDYEDPQQRSLLCGSAGCDSNSLVQQISLAASSKHLTKIAKMPNSWIDDFLDWSNPVVKCCRFYEDEPDRFCNASVKSTNCEDCLAGEKLDGAQFDRLLPFFLSDVPSIDCPKGGKAAYSSSVSFASGAANSGVGGGRSQVRNGKISSSYFMTYHVALRTSDDFTEALIQSRALAAEISKTINAQVYPYSVFYVFYEQYLTIVEDTFLNMSLSLVSIFLVTFFFLGLDFASALFVGLTILMIIVSMCGMMFLWDISLNAISLVNLVMAVGISVEFCAHTVRTFAVNPHPSRLQRAKDSLLEMGSSVLSGITLTKLGGIIVLAFSRSQLFKVFYFRMYLCVVIFGAAHGLVFLPVLLSYIGWSSRSFNCSVFKTSVASRSPGPSKGEPKPMLEHLLNGDCTQPVINHKYNLVLKGTAAEEEEQL